ncbi:MAG: hypothetical protein K5930_11700 [Treponemataceae bacterium]|nr:hypothetical protein [Treponemataceae bacterium]
MKKKLLAVVVAFSVIFTSYITTCSFPVEEKKDTTPPGEVLGLEGTPGDRYVTLKWTDPSDSDLSEIEITVELDGESIDTYVVNKGVQEKTISRLENGSKYKFILKSVDTSGNKSSGRSITRSPKAPTVPQTPSVPTVPQTPSAPTLSPFDSEIAVSWAPVANATEYEIWYDTNPTTLECKYTTVFTSTLISGLTNGVTYYFSIKAKNSAGTSRSSPITSTQPMAPTPVPQPPSTPTLTSGDSQIVVSWAPVADAEEYEIWYATSYNSTINPENLRFLKSTTSTSETITNLTNGLTYFVAIKAKNIAGTSERSQITSAQPKASIPTGKLTEAQVRELAPEILYHRAEEKNKIEKENYHMVAWAQAIPINSLVDGSQQPKIEMDYLKVSRYQNDKWELKVEDDYNDGIFITSINSVNKNGCLYTRYKWFDGDEPDRQYDGFIASESNSVLSFTMNETDKIYHWWTDSSQSFRIGDGYRIEARVRISGPSLFQIGADLKEYPGQGNVIALCTSDWYASTDGEWITITVECLDGYVRNQTKKVTFNVKFKDQYINKISSVQISGNWNNWTTWINMYRIDPLNYTFVSDFAANTSLDYNIYFIYKALNVFSDDDWVAKREGISSYVDKYNYVIDGITKTPELVPNGLQGNGESQNLRIYIP